MLDWTFGHLLAVVNCLPDRCMQLLNELQFRRTETFVDLVHNLLFVHLYQNFCGLYHGSYVLYIHSKEKLIVF